MDILKKSLGIALVLAAAWGICGGKSFAEAAGGAPRERKADSSPVQALEALKKAYQEENLEAFFAHVVSDPVFNTTELKQRLTERFAHASDIDLIFHVDHELPEKDHTLVKTHWQRRFTNDAGHVETAEGTAHLVFARSGPGGPYKLLNIREDDPF